MRNERPSKFTTKVISEDIELWVSRMRETSLKINQKSICISKKTKKNERTWVIQVFALQKFKDNFFIVFWCDLPLLAVFIIFVLFCHQVVILIHLVFRQTRELNSCPRTMAQTVSPQRSPLDQGASPRQILHSGILNSRCARFVCKYKSKFENVLLIFKCQVIRHVKTV